MAEDDPLLVDDEALLAQCRVERFRVSGPGGQHRNKVESAVRITHLPTGVTTQAFESRSQHENRARALERLRAAIALEVRRPVDLDGYEPSERLRAILPGARQQVRARNPAFWAGAAELLDVLVAERLALAATAARLGLSTGQLSRLITGETALLAAVNRLRADAGLHPLR